MVIAKDITTTGIHQEDHTEGVTEGIETGENGRASLGALKQSIYLFRKGSGMHYKRMLEEY